MTALPWLSRLFYFTVALFEGNPSFPILPVYTGAHVYICHPCFTSFHPYLLFQSFCSNPHLTQLPLGTSEGSPMSPLLWHCPLLTSSHLQVPSALRHSREEPHQGPSRRWRSPGPRSKKMPPGLPRCVKNPPASAGDTRSNPDLGRSHMPWCD